MKSRILKERNRKCVAGDWVRCIKKIGPINVHDRLNIRSISKGLSFYGDSNILYEFIIGENGFSEWYPSCFFRAIN